MKRRLAPSLFALSLCAMLGGARAAGAQAATATVPPTIDSVAGAARVDAAPTSRAAQPGNVVLDLSPVARPGSFYVNGEAAGADALPARAPFQGRDWKMPTSRTLMIGGTAAALIGLIAIGGDTGAIIAMAGGGVAVYGLYLHYNR